MTLLNARLSHFHRARVPSKLGGRGTLTPVSARLPGERGKLASSGVGRKGRSGRRRDDAVPGRLTLAEESIARARSRIIAGARAALSEVGYAATMDKIAERAGVSRRTVFRHFPTIGQLLASTSTLVWKDYEAAMASLPEPGQDVEAWLTEMAIKFHRMHRDIGALWWSLHDPVPPSIDELRSWREEWVVSRPRNARVFATTAWQGAGGAGDPPAWLIEAFQLQISGFAYHGLRVDQKKTPEQTGAEAGHVMTVLLRVALQPAS